MIILSQVPLAPGAHSPGPVSPFDPSTGFDWSSDPGLYIPTQGRLALAQPSFDDWAIPVTPSVYGSAFNIDSKDNQRLDGSVVGVMFRAASTTTISGIVWQIRRGTGYSLGTNGTVRVSIQADDGTSNHWPSGTDLASTDVGGGADHSGAAGGYVIWTAFASPPSISKGTFYHVVFTNVDGSPASNYVSVNSVWTSGSTLVPRQPAFADTEYKMSYFTAGSWSTLAKDTSDIDVVCADGQHLGSAYIQAKIDFWGVIAGPNSKVRCNFTVSGGDRIVTAVNARISQQSGTGNLTLRLEDGSGTLIESGSVSTTGIAAWTLGADPAAGTWFRFVFSVPHVLTNGSTYHLVLSTDNSTSYAMVPMLYRDGSDDGTHFMQSRAFTDGTGEKTTDGTTWVTIYGAFPQNIQTYFETMAVP